MVQVGIRLTQTNSEIQRAIVKAFVEELNDHARRLRPKLESFIRGEVVKRLVKCETVVSLKAGKLRGEFGLSDSNISKVDKLIFRFSQSVKVTFSPVRTTGRGFSTAPFLKVTSESLSELADSPNAEVITRKGMSIPFLEMLTEWGDKQIIGDAPQRLDPPVFHCPDGTRDITNRGLVH